MLVNLQSIVVNMVFMSIALFRFGINAFMMVFDVPPHTTNKVVWSRMLWLTRLLLNISSFHFLLLSMLTLALELKAQI